MEGQTLLAHQRLVILQDGQIMPLTGLFDWEGDLTQSFEDAVAFTCGSPKQGFFAGVIRDFPLRTFH